MSQTSAFTLEQFHYVGGDGIPTATVVVRTPTGEVVSAASIGNGPIDAVCQAIGTIVDHQHTILKCQLGSRGKGSNAPAYVNVRIKSGNKTFAAEGISTDIVRAAALAYIQAINMMIEVQEGVAVPA